MLSDFSTLCNIFCGHCFLGHHKRAFVVATWRAFSCLLERFSSDVYLGRSCDSNTLADRSFGIGRGRVRLGRTLVLYLAFQSLVPAGLPLSYVVSMKLCPNLRVQTRSERQKAGPQSPLQACTQKSSLPWFYPVLNFFFFFLVLFLFKDDIFHEWKLTFGLICGTVSGNKLLTCSLLLSLNQ